MHVYMLLTSVPKSTRTQRLLHRWLSQPEVKEN